jgi:hypothetical protein
VSGDGLDELRRNLAAERGLDEAALPYITGSTVDEIEQSVDGFAKLIGSHAEQEQQQQPSAPLAGLFADAARAKAERKHALFQALTGRSEQARDEQGRFAGSASLDCGARQAVAAAPETHDSWLGRVLASRAADVGSHF